MMQATCIRKYVNTNNIITQYRILCANNEIRDIEPKKLKAAIRNNQIMVDNLKLTRDNRLISKKTNEDSSNKVVYLGTGDIRHIDCEKNLKFKTKINIEATLAKAQLIDAKIIPYSNKIILIENENDIVLATSADKLVIESCNSVFSNKAFRSIDMTNLDTSLVVNASYMFECAKAKHINISNMKTYNMRDMTSMFEKVKLNELDLSNFNTSHVENMCAMYTGCKIKNLDLSNFNTSKVKSMYTMFMNCEIENLDISNFDYSEIMKIGGMFHYCDIKTLNLGSFNLNINNIKNEKQRGIFYDSNIGKIITTRKTQSNVEIITRNNSIGNINELRGVFYVR